MWILSTVASMGYLSRMTQWKVSGWPLLGERMGIAGDIGSGR
jgi:hypothetical protein